MKTSSNSRISRIAAVTGILIGAFAISVLADSVWVSAPPNPPSGNVDAPINAGYGPQTKKGGIILNSLDSTDGNPVMSYGLWVVSAPIKAGGGLIIETRNGSDPSNPETGRMWLRTDL